MIKYLRLLLLPFSLIYAGITILRNKLYDLGVFRSRSFDIPVICVGNLVVGGSGKSPVTEYLIGLFPDLRIAVLSRGYGRDTTGFIRANENSTARSVGDEPLQFYRKFPQVTVAVCEDRVFGIDQLKSDHDLIILDDAFQHRRVKAGFNILLFEYQKLLEPQFVLPAGNMREVFSGYQRADLLMVTKSPVIANEGQKQQLAEKFDEAARDKVFFSSIQYGNLTGLITQQLLNWELLGTQTVFLLTGIANPDPLLDHIKGYGPPVIHHNYPDHHVFSFQNISKLVKAFKAHPAKEKIILTTEKDAQRLIDITIKELLLDLPVFYLPIRILIEEKSKNKFDQKILDYVSNTARNR